MVQLELFPTEPTLENKTAQIVVTKIYEHPLCDCCCDAPGDVLNFVDYSEDLVSEKTEIKIK